MSGISGREVASGVLIGNDEVSVAVEGAEFAQAVAKSATNKIQIAVLTSLIF